MASLPFPPDALTPRKTTAWQARMDDLRKRLQAAELTALERPRNDATLRTDSVPSSETPGQEEPQVDSHSGAKDLDFKRYRSPTQKVSPKSPTVKDPPRPLRLAAALDPASTSGPANKSSTSPPPHMLDLASDFDRHRPDSSSKNQAQELHFDSRASPGPHFFDFPIRDPLLSLRKDLPGSHTSKNTKNNDEKDTSAQFSQVGHSCDEKTASNDGKDDIANRTFSKISPVEVVWLPAPPMTPRRRNSRRSSLLPSSSPKTFATPAQSPTKASTSTPRSTSRVRVGPKGRRSSLSGLGTPSQSLLPYLPHPSSPSDDPLLLKGHRGRGQLSDSPTASVRLAPKQLLAKYAVDRKASDQDDDDTDETASETWTEQGLFSKTKFNRPTLEDYKGHTSQTTPNPVAVFSDEDSYSPGDNGMDDMPSLSSEDPLYSFESRSDQDSMTTPTGWKTQSVFSPTSKHPPGAATTTCKISDVTEDPSDSVLAVEVQTASVPEPMAISKVTKEAQDTARSANHNATEMEKGVARLALPSELDSHTTRTKDETTYNSAILRDEAQEDTKYDSMVSISSRSPSPGISLSMQKHAVNSSSRVDVGQSPRYVKEAAISDEPSFHTASVDSTSFKTLEPFADSPSRTVGRDDVQARQSTWSRTHWARLEGVLIAQVESNPAWNRACTPHERGNVVRETRTGRVIKTFLELYGIDIAHLSQPSPCSAKEASLPLVSQPKSKGCKNGGGEEVPHWSLRVLQARSRSLRIGLAKVADLGLVHPGSVKEDLRKYRRDRKSIEPATCCQPPSSIQHSTPAQYCLPPARRPLKHAITPSSASDETVVGPCVGTDEQNKTAAQASDEGPTSTLPHESSVCSLKESVTYLFDKPSDSRHPTFISLLGAEGLAEARVLAQRLADQRWIKNFPSTRSKHAVLGKTRSMTAISSRSSKTGTANLPVLLRRNATQFGYTKQKSKPSEAITSTRSSAVALGVKAPDSKLNVEPIALPSLPGKAGGLTQERPALYPQQSKLSSNFPISQSRIPGPNIKRGQPGADLRTKNSLSVQKEKENVSSQASAIP